MNIPPPFTATAFLLEKPSPLGITTGIFVVKLEDFVGAFCTTFAIAFVIFILLFVTAAALAVALIARKLLLFPDIGFIVCVFLIVPVPIFDTFTIDFFISTAGLGTDGAFFFVTTFVAAVADPAT